MTIDISKLKEPQLTALMGRIQARLAEIQLEKVARVRDKVMAMITSEGLDYADLMEHSVRARKSKRGKVKPKYRNPANSQETWSGRGRQPRWFAAAIKIGKKESRLLIK
ncbi:MAG TPA: H-NS histone family protein [Candidatus Limnocylindria bacterium]|nr:H-NS histone family protein [Candidatus Limnocylindria bacterium]